MQTFSIKESIKFGWKTIFSQKKRDVSAPVPFTEVDSLSVPTPTPEKRERRLIDSRIIQFFLILIVLLFIAPPLVSSLGPIFNSSSYAFFILVSLLSFFLLQGALIVFRKKEPSPHENISSPLFKQLPVNFAKYLATNFLLIFITVTPFILLLSPVIFEGTISEYSQNVTEMVSTPEAASFSKWPTLFAPYGGLVPGSLFLLKAHPFYYEMSNDLTPFVFMILLIPAAFMANPFGAIPIILFTVAFPLTFPIFIALNIRLSLAISFVLDRNMGPFQAIAKSWRATRGNTWKLFWFGILLAVINLLGLAFLFIGLIITIPLTVLAFVHAYNELGGKEALSVPTPKTTHPPAPQF